MLNWLVPLVLVFLHFGTGGKNSSGSMVDHTTCENDKEKCDQPSEKKVANPTEKDWKPFIFESSSVWVTLDSLYPAYTKWHNETLYDVTIPCNRKKALVFIPNAGLGDSIGALTAAFYYAIKTGRMLFIDWKPNDWSIGLKPLPFRYDYSTAKSLRDPITENPLLCVEQSNDPASFMHGHVTSQHAIVEDPVINDFHFGGDRLSEILIQPSTKVDEIIQRVTSSNQGQSNTRKVALVIRTGEGEYNQFLSKGDEFNFVKCFRNYAKSESDKSMSNKYRVFVTSDNLEVKNRVIEELKTGDNGGLSVDVLSLDDSIIHVMHVEENEKKQSVLNKIRKTYAEFFLIGQCDVLFLTHGSLFGRTAADRGKATESNVYFISDSHCDGTREKYSYLQCHDPKYPKVCGFA